MRVSPVLFVPLPRGMSAVRKLEYASPYARPDRKIHAERAPE